MTVRRIPVVLACLLALVQHPAQGAEAGPEDARLVVAVVDDRAVTPINFGKRLQNVVAYRFDDKGVSADTLLSNPGAQLRFTTETSRLYKDKYLLADTGDIVDLGLREIVHRGGSGPWTTRFVAAEGDRVILRSPQTSECFSFDLAKRVYGPLDPPGKYALPGLLSPSGTASVSAEETPGEIWLHPLKGDSRRLGTGFGFELSPLASTASGVLPMMWLDDERILTQVSNGQIVVADLDGKVHPVVKIEFPAGGTGRAAGEAETALSASLFRDSGDRIIYAIHLSTDEDRGWPRYYLIDLAGKTYRELDQVWSSAGCDFEIGLVPDSDGQRPIRYRGTEIGRHRFEPSSVRTGDGRIALVASYRQVANSSRPEVRFIQAWTAGSGKWTRIDFYSRVWIPYQAVIGWLPNRCKD